MKSTVQTTALRAIGGLLSPGRRWARLIILTYHRVCIEPDPLLPSEVYAAAFDWHMATLKQYFNVLSLQEAAQRLVKKSLPARAICVTFDDGYANNHQVALPILRKWSIPATFFIAVQFLEGGEMWNDSVIEAIRQVSGTTLALDHLGLGHYAMVGMRERYQAVKSILEKLKYLGQTERKDRVKQLLASLGGTPTAALMMNAGQVHELHAAGMEIGAHTVSHPILAKLSATQADQEIIQSRDTLRQITGADILAFAYPNGRPHLDYDRSHVDMVRRAGFKLAVSTAPGCARSGDDTLQLPRMDFWDKTAMHFMLRMLRSYVSRRALVA